MPQPWCLPLSPTVSLAGPRQFTVALTCCSTGIRISPSHRFGRNSPPKLHPRSVNQRHSSRTVLVSNVHAVWTRTTTAVHLDETLWGGKGNCHTENDES